MSKINKAIIPFIAATTFLATGCASWASNTELPPSQLTINSHHDQQILANHKGFSVYTFDKDKLNTSNCYGPCAIKWPPVLADKEISKGDYTTTERKDGLLQLQYKAKPLYLWVGDKAPGETTGDGVKNVWHLVAM